jgi:hypothetical protein
VHATIQCGLRLDSLILLLKLSGMRDHYPSVAQWLARMRMRSSVKTVIFDRMIRVDVSIVQNPTISLARDVSATKLIIGSLPSPVILVGRCHHRGGDSPERRWIGGYHFLRSG